MTKSEVALIKYIMGLTVLAIAVMAFQEHPSGRRYWQVLLATLGLL